MENFTTLYSSANNILSPFWELGVLDVCIITFNFISGFSAHCFVIWLIVTGTGILSEFFNFSLSVCGVIFSVNSLLLLVTKWFPFRLLIALTQFLVGLGITGHPLFQCLICVERYLAVVHPVTFLKYKHFRYRVISSAAAWIMTLGSCFFCLFVFFSRPSYVYMWYYSTHFLLFLFIQLFCLVAVLRELKQSGPGEGKRGGKRGEENHMKRKAFYLILETTFSLIIKYVPFTVSGLVTVTTNMSFQIFWSLSYLCFVLADLVHPIHYMYRIGKFLCFSLPK